MGKVNETEILIVDDSEDNRLILEELTRNLGYFPILAENGKQGQDILQKQIPILMLLDINMPEMDGIQLLTWVKNQDRLKDMPVLMVSAYDDVESIVKCLQIGAEDFIPKPFDPEILEVRMNNVLVLYKAKLVEKDLLEKTFVGSVKILSSLLTLLVPKIFGKSARIQRYAKSIAVHLDFENIWEIELASIFSMVGTILIPSDILERVVLGKSLSPDEKQLYESHPILGAKLLRNIPRMERIAELVNLQNVHIDTTKAEHINSLKLGSDLILGIQVLRAAIEYEVIQNKSKNPVDFMKFLRVNDKHLDSETISAMEKTMYMDYSKDVKTLNVDGIREGMVFAEDVYAKNDSKIVGQWQEATHAFLIRLKQIQDNIGVKEPILVYIPSKN